MTNLDFAAFSLLCSEQLMCSDIKDGLFYLTLFLMSVCGINVARETVEMFVCFSLSPVVNH